MKIGAGTVVGGGTMHGIGTLHLLTAFAAIGCGAVVLRLPKGTRWHRTWGHAYVWSMVGIVVTSFMLYNLTGGITPFHGAAVVAAITVAVGLYTVLARRPKKHWIEAHANWMAWSYVGLMAAFTAESLTRFAMPRLAGLLAEHELQGAFWVLVGVATLAVTGVGALVIRARLAGAIAGAPASIRREKRELESGEA